MYKNHLKHKQPTTSKEAFAFQMKKTLILIQQIPSNKTQQPTKIILTTKVIKPAIKLAIKSAKTQSNQKAIKLPVCQLQKLKTD